jgi:hypothetical protein
MFRKVLIGGALGLIAVGKRVTYHVTGKP